MRNVLYKWKDADDLVELFRELFEDTDLAWGHPLSCDERKLLDLALQDLRKTERGLHGTAARIRLILTDGEREEINPPFHLEVEVEPWQD